MPLTFRSIGMNAAGFFEASGGNARLLKRDELPDDWEPSADSSATVWEACQHLIKRLTAEDGGIDAAAALYNRLGALAEPAHALARRLYDICEQKQWASEGRVYNQLHQEWDVIEKRAADVGRNPRRPVQPLKGIFMSGFASNQRINQALLLLTKVLQPYVEKRMRDAYRGNWQQNLSVAAGTDMSKPLDAYALLKTMVDNWQTAFRDGLKPIVRNHVSLALAARNEMAHASDTIADTDAISYLRSIQAVVEAIDPKSAAGVKALLERPNQGDGRSHGRHDRGGS